MKEDKKEVTIKLSEKELAEVNKVLGALGKKIVPEECKSKKVDIEPEEPFNYTDESPIVTEINGSGTVFIHSSYFEDANIDEDSDPHMYANKTDIYLTDLRKDEIDWQGEEVEYWGTVARGFAGDLPLDLDGVWECINPYGDTCTISVSDHFIKIHYTGDGVDEDEDEEKKEEAKKVESYTEEDTIHIIPEMLEAAGINKKHHLYIFGNDDDHVLYITDLRKEDIDWGEQDVEEWCNGVIFNSFGEIEIEAKNFWPADLCNPYGGNKMTADYTDHIITVTLEVDEDYFEQWSKETRIVPQEFTVATDAEGRATLNRKIFEAADLIDHVDTWCLFKNDSSTKLYITWKDHPYLDFNGEVCTGIKDIERNGKTSLRIKLGEPYTNYKVYTTGEEDKEVITIDLCSGYQIVESEDIVNQVKESADKKIEEDKKTEELKKKAEELVYEIFGDVEKIKVMTGLDLSNIITKVVKAILSGKKVF